MSRGPSSVPRGPCSFAAPVRHFLKPWTLGFGGPVALVASMRRDLVEERNWISEADGRKGLATTANGESRVSADEAVRQSLRR